MWKEQANALFFIDHIGITEIATIVKKARETVSRYIAQCEGYEEEMAFRKEHSEEQRKEYQRQWDRDNRADRYSSISGESLRREHEIATLIFTAVNLADTLNNGMPSLKEPLLTQSGTREALIESNNGGRGFARNVIEQLKKLRNKKCNVTWFHQSKNKKTRIIVNATNVMDQVIMPEGWKKKYPEFFKAIQTYQRKGKNKHDDAADTLTGFVEMINGEVKGINKVKVLDRKKFGGIL